MLKLNQQIFTAQTFSFGVGT